MMTATFYYNTHSILEMDILMNLWSSRRNFLIRALKKAGRIAGKNICAIPSVTIIGKITVVPPCIQNKDITFVN